MTVLTCSHCGAPHEPRASRCAYCAAPFADGAGDVPRALVDADIEALVRQQNLIGAIKLYRQRHKTDLLTAKNAVESLKARLGL